MKKRTEEQTNERTYGIIKGQRKKDYHYLLSITIRKNIMLPSFLVKDMATSNNIYARLLNLAPLYLTFTVQINGFFDF